MISNNIFKFIQAYSAEFSEGGKNWNFPKIHSQMHAVDDIKAKGVTRNYNTKTNEKMHGPIKDSYHLRTNFKDVANQILGADHICFVSLLIRGYIDHLDDYNKKIQMDAVNSDTLDSKIVNKPIFPPVLQYHVTVGSPQTPITLAALEQQHSALKNDSFKNFSKKLAAFLNDFLPKHGVDLPDDFVFPLRLNPGEKVCLVQ